MAIDFGKHLENTTIGLLLVIITLILVVNLLAQSISSIFTSFAGLGTNLTANGQSTAGGFFAAGGIVGLIFGFIILVVVIIIVIRMLKQASGGGR